VSPVPDYARLSGPDAPTNRRTPPPAVTSKPFFPDDSGDGSEVDTAFGGGNGSGLANLGIQARGRQIQGEPGLSYITLNNTGSGYVEKFLLYAPVLLVGQRAPVLVVFHRYGVSEWDAYYYTSFFEEARRRGWFLIAPRAMSQKSFNRLEGQINVEAALGFLNSSYNVDLNRVYAVGFSMGGGLATSYAARHVDPNGMMFAALVNHTGTVSQGDAWASEYQDEASNQLETAYGGTPADHPFNYQRCSVIDIDHATGLVGSGTDMGRNMTHLPIRNWMANNDPMQYLRNQTTAFDTYLNGEAVNTTLTIVDGNVHSWSTLDETVVCDWLSQFSLQLPRLASTMADQDGNYFWWQVSQTTSGAFTPFSWYLDSVANRISLYNTANLEQVSIDATAAGLQYATTLKINLTTSDGTGDKILLTNMTAPPLSVTRDGLAASGTWDPTTNTFLVTETQGNLHQWRLNF
jgi:dienelactone hydrolase